MFATSNDEKAFLCSSTEKAPFIMFIDNI